MLKLNTSFRALTYLTLLVTREQGGNYTLLPSNAGCHFPHQPLKYKEKESILLQGAKGGEEGSNFPPQSEDERLFLTLEV